MSTTLDWGYSKRNGPETWARGYPEAGGNQQSPIDIKQVNIRTVKTDNRLAWRYVPENTETVTNTGYSWEVEVNGEGSELVGGPLQGKYVLRQFHCHWGETNDQGSEHSVDGKKFAGELHLVHWNSTKYGTFQEAAKYPDGLCVLGVFLNVGRRNHELNKVISKLSQVQYKSEIAKIDYPLDPAALIPPNSGYYTYHGSLTTPPCSECVIWIVFKDPIEVSQEQLDECRKLKNYKRIDTCPVDEFEGFVKNNFRPTVPLGQRDIKECLEQLN